MADTLINLLAWCKRERERLQMQREMLQSGRFQIFERRLADACDQADRATHRSRRVIELLEMWVLRYRTPLEKLTGGLRRGSPY